MGDDLTLAMFTWLSGHPKAECEVQLYAMVDQVKAALDAISSMCWLHNVRIVSTLWEKSIRVGNNKEEILCLAVVINVTVILLLR
jgi:hypothetical protein